MPMKNLVKRLSIKNLRKRSKSVANPPEYVASGHVNSESPQLPLPAQNKRNGLGQKENPLVQKGSSETKSSISERGAVITSNLTDIPPVPPIPNTLSPEDDMLTSTWNFVQDLTETKKGGKADEVLEKVENTVVSAQALQTNSAPMITAITTGLQKAGSFEAVERGIGHLFEGSQVLMNFLDEVEKLHPFIGVAVIAFKTVLHLVMTRKENDKRILALHYEMKDMMAVLIELKNVKDINKVAPDGSTIEARMQTLVHKTVGDITDCGNTCHAYNKLNIVVKVLGGSIWEERLTRFGVVFKQRRDEFKFALTIHITTGVDEANLGIQTLKQTAEELKSMMTEMFRHFASPELKKLAAAAEEMGGIKEVRQSYDKIKELTELGPKSASGMVAQGAPSKNEGASKKSDLDKILDDLNTDVDTALKKNEIKFRQMFEFQKDEIKKGTKQIIDALTAGPHDRIRDEDVREVWKEMAWRGSAKTRHFVNALRDHFSDKWNNKQVNLSNSDSNAETPITHMLNEDKWALEYLNLRNLQQISEVFDDDTSGFVTINEVNSFTTSRPEGWTLPHWVAYWAIGWNMTLKTYQGKLQELLGKMFALLPSIRKENLPAANEYLCGIYVYAATLYNSVNHCYINPDLEARFQGYVKIEEDRLRKNLEAFKYDIDGYDTLRLICGKGDIEKFLLPLLYLILARHFEIFRVARKRVLHAEELPDAQDTVMWIVYKVTLRIETLKTTLKQQKLDPDEQFESFAHGLFSRWDLSKMWSPDRIREIQAPCYLYTEESEDQGVDAQEVCNHPLDLNIVDYAAYDDTSFETYETRYNLIESNNAPSSLKLLLGSWTASVYSGPLTSTGCIQICLEQDSASNNTSDTFKAAGKANGSEFTILGSCRCDEVTGIIHVSFTRSFLSQDPDELWKGELDVERETISGKVSFGEEVEDLSTINDQFVMKRMSSVVMRFRPSPTIFEETKVQALWMLATAAICAQVRNRDTWLWAYIKARRDTRKRFVELYIRSTGVGRGLQDEELEEFMIIKGSSTASDLRYWHSVAQLKLRITITHDGFICDACRIAIVDARVVCLDCTPNDYTWNSVDFCDNGYCSLQEVKRDDLKHPHQPTHGVVKVRRHVHVPYFGEFRQNSKEALQRARSFFQKGIKGQEKDKDKGGRSDPPEANPDENQAIVLQCILCKSLIEQPCWYCVHCTDGTFICDKCDTKGEAALDYARLKHYKGTHEFYFHDLVRCAERVSENTEEIITIEDRLNQLENQFSSHKETMSNKLNELKNLLGDIVNKLGSS